MPRCLIVDDDPAIRSLLLDYLRQFGHEVEAVPDGAGLRKRLAAGGIELLLLDLMLPDQNGLDLCRWVKQTRPELPVIMLTAQGDPLSRVLGSSWARTTTWPSPSNRASWWRASRQCCGAARRRHRPAAACASPAGPSTGCAASCSTPTAR